MVLGDYSPVSKHKNVALTGGKARPTVFSALHHFFS